MSRRPRDRVRPSLALAAVLALTAAPAQARERTTIVRVKGSTERVLATYGGVTAVSLRERGRYRLAVIEDGRLRRLRVPPSDDAYDPDVGPDTRGRPAVVYSRDGDLFIHRLRGGGEEPIRTASTPDGDESEPSLWRGRIAWWHEDGVMTRNRLLPRAARSRRVPGVPRDTELVQVEVRGRLVATTDYHGPLDPDTPRQFLRLHDLGTGKGRRLWVNGSGIGGQTLVGLSFAGPWLGFARSCLGDPGGCLDGGPRRYHVTERRHEWWTGYRTLQGFALLRDGTLELTEDGRLQRLGPPPWKPIPRRQIRD